MRRFKNLLVTITLVSLLLCIVNTPAFAYTTGDDYPSEYKTPAIDTVVDRWNFYNRECTSFAAWCLNSRNGIAFHNWLGGIRWGHAATWDDAASQLGYTVDQNPAVGAIAYWDNGKSGSSSTYGHVAWVREVNGNNVTIEEYNWAVSGGYGTRTFDKNNPSGYIHIQDIVVTGTLDVNFLVNGTEKGSITDMGVGTFDITVAGSTLTGQTDYYRSDLANGTSYSISNIKPAAGYNYTGLRSGSDSLSGSIAAGTQRTVWLCFESKTYTVSYNANGGTGAPSSQTKTHDTPLTLSSTIPIRDNYEFLGWSTSSTATTATYHPGGQYTTNASGTLYAVWKLKSYTITFNPNGGTVSPTTKTVSYGSTYGTLPTTTRAGYTFDGWFTSADGGTKITASTVLTENADQTVFAHWSPIGELALPSAIQTIDDESFMGDSNVSHVVIPANCITIGSKAFANCENLVSVRILGKSTTFESNTFDESKNVVIYCYSGSRAQRLASADGIEYHLIGVASDWVLTDDVPQGAEITDRKWTYTLREYAESSSASYSGWTKYDSKRTSWTSWSGWQDSEVTSSSDREVKTQQVISGYNMISYCVSGPNGRSYQPSPTYSVRLQHGPYWWSKAELDSARVFSAGSYFDYASNVAGYVLDATGYCKWDGSDTGGYVPMFIQDTTYKTQWSYRDAVYTYYYYRDLSEESATDPSGQENVSNVQEWVKYIY